MLTGDYPLALPLGTILAGQYEIDTVLGQGGFGITYRAHDHRTGGKVAIKEFFPDSLAARTGGTAVSAFSGDRSENFTYGKNCFLQEAETLAKFIGNDNIVRVHCYFEENGTAYFVMDYIDGISFADYIGQYGGKITYEQSLNVLIPVMDALGAVHNQGIIHRDVTPDNIFITQEGIVKLIDFGAARYSLGDRSQSLDIVLKHGYAPKEQYMRRGRQGPYTDIYSLGACFYFAVTGKLPPDSVDRLDEDNIVPLRELGADMPEVAEKAILKALSVRAEDRFRSMEEFKMALFGRWNPSVAKPVIEQKYFTSPAADEKDRSSSYPRSAEKDKGKRSAPLILYIGIATAGIILVAALIVAGSLLFFADAAEDEENRTVEVTADAAGTDTDEEESGDAAGTDTDEEESGDEDSVGTGSDEEETADDTGAGNAQMGILGYTITDDMAERTGLSGGAYIESVSEGLGADEAGLQTGDIVISIDGRTIVDMQTLKTVVSSHKAGDVIELIILREEDGEYVRRDLSVTLSPREEV